MACGGCQKKRAAAAAAGKITENDLMGGYKYLTDRQIKARLEIYKKRYCPNCDNRYKCDYSLYVKCKKNN
jgi:hypothetical protein